MKQTVLRSLLVAAAGLVPIAIVLLLPRGTWADVGSLPGHPLIVHGVVVLLPLAAVWVLVSAWRPAVFERTHLVAYGLTVVCALAAVAAKSSGESLAAAVGLPDEHAEAGSRLMAVAIALAAVVLLMFLVRQFLDRRPAVLASSVLASLVAVAVIPLTFAAGHSGAEASWEQEYADAQLPISDGTGTFTSAEVADHDTASDCWTVVDGVVYDMTSFTERHPAGAEAILDMCGDDGSEDFLEEHAGQGEPEKWLDTLKIGVLANP